MGRGRIGRGRMKIRTIGLTLLLVGAGAGRIEAGNLVSLDPGVPERGLAPAAPDSTITTSPSFELPGSFLGRKLVHYSGVVATTRPAVDLGLLGNATEWTLERRDAAIQLSELPRPFSGAPAATPMGTWTCEDGKDGGVRVTGVAPMWEAGSLYSSKTDTAPELRVQSVAPISDVHVTTAELSFVETYTIGTAATTPTTPEVIVYRRHFLVRDPVLAPRSYSPSDLKSVALFSLGQAFAGGRTLDNDLVVRWNLQQPIRFVIHPTVPEKYRALATRALLSWNDAFQQVAGVAPVHVEVGDESIVPGTPGVIVLYWVSRDRVRDWRGVSTSIMHPENAELLGGQILLSEQQILDDSPAESRFRALQDAVMPPDGFAPVPGGAPLASTHQGRSPQLTGAPIDPALLERGLEGTIAHESGHCLGLRHNFKASADVERIPAGEHSTSVMDYLREANKPLHPLPYDMYALALAQGLPLHEPFAGPFLMGTDEQVATDVDCNKYDEGVPLEWATRSLQELRRLARDPQVYVHHDALLSEFDASYRILAKVLAQDSHARHDDVLALYEAALSDAGADPLVAGGTAGKPLTDWEKMPADQLSAKRGHERMSALWSIATVSAKVGCSPATLGRLCAKIAPIAVDAAGTDAFCVRYQALRALGDCHSLLAMESLRQVSDGLRQRVQGQPGGPTDQQDRWLLERCDAMLAASGTAGLAAR